MILTDQFLNIACSALLSDHKEFGINTFNELNDVLTHYNNNCEIALGISQKFKLIYSLSMLRTSGKSIDSAVDNVKAGGSFKDMDDFITVKMDTKLTSDIVEDYIKQIKLRKKFILIFKEYNRLNDFIDDFNSNSFSDLEKAIGEYEDIVSTLYTDMSENRRQDNVARVSSIDFLEDDLDPVLNQMEENYSGVNTVQSGYADIDDAMYGGYNPSRLYIIGGSSGDGKSTFLMNCLKNAIELDKKEGETRNTYSYITLENLLDETVLRLYSCWAEKKPFDVLKDLKTERHEIKDFIGRKLDKNQSNIDMRYYPPDTLSVLDIQLYIQALKDKCAATGQRLRAVYIDYLDLLKSGSTFDQYRMELGKITMLLKAVAVIENIPIITVTQLNRAGYDKKDYSLTQMSESIKKVEHADFVALLKLQDDKSAQDEQQQSEEDREYSPLEFFIGKNRSGPKNIKITLKCNFSKFLIKDGVNAGEKSSNMGMSFNTDDTNDQLREVSEKKLNVAELIKEASENGGIGYEAGKRHLKGDGI